MLDRMGARALIDYTCFIGHLIIVLHLQSAFGRSDGPQSREEVAQVLAGIRDGTIELPDHVHAVKAGPGG